MKKAGILFLFIFIEASCNKDNVDKEPKLPNTKKLVIGSPLSENISKGNLQYYSVAVSQGQNYSVSMTGLTDKKMVLGQATNKTFSILSSLLQGEVSPKAISIMATDTVIFVLADAASVVAPVANYTLLVMPVTPMPNPVNEGSINVQVPVAAGTPFEGRVATRGTSYYAAKNLVAGTSYIISLTGLTQDADLHLFTDSSYSMELDCTLNSAGDVTNVPEECIVQASGDLYFSVRCGELNRVGTGYTILIKAK